MKRKMTGLLTIVLAVMMLCACGGSGETGNTKNGGEYLNLWITTLGEEAEVIEKVTEEQWNVEHPDSKVKVTVVPGNSDDFYQKLAIAFATKTGPDMFCISNAEMLKYVETGVAYDVTSYLEANRADYMEGTLESLTFDGKIMAFPGNMDIMALYCSKEAFEGAGIDYPKTWEELINATNALANEDRYGIILQTDLQSGYQVFEFYPFLWMSGGDVLNEDGTRVVIDSDGAAKAFSFYRDIFGAPGTCKKVENSNTDITPFATGRTAMQICGSWAVSWLKANYSEMEYAVVPYPAAEQGMPSASIIGGWQYMVSSKSKNPEAAALYLNWLLNQGTEIPTEMATRAAKISPRLSVLENGKEFYSQYPFDMFVNTILPTANREPVYPTSIVMAVGDALQEAIYTDKPVETILSETQAKCELLLN